jgi:hypothetical protein
MHSCSLAFKALTETSSSHTVEIESSRLQVAWVPELVLFSPLRRGNGRAKDSYGSRLHFALDWTRLDCFSVQIVEASLCHGFQTIGNAFDKFGNRTVDVRAVFQRKE